MTSNPEEERTLLAELRTLMAEKRTLLAYLRTAAVIFTIPLSIFTVLLATSKYYDLQAIFFPFTTVVCFCIILLSLGVYMIANAFRQIRSLDRSIKTLKKKK